MLKAYSLLNIPRIVAGYQNLIPFPTPWPPHARASSVSGQVVHPSSPNSGPRRAAHHTAVARLMGWLCG